MVPILLNSKVHALTINLLVCNDSIMVVIIWALELVIDVLQHQNIGDERLIRLYLTIPFYFSFLGGLWDFVIYLNFQRIYFSIFLLNVYCYKIVRMCIYCQSVPGLWYIIYCDLQHYIIQTMKIHDHYHHVFHYTCNVKSVWVYSISPFLKYTFHMYYYPPCRWYCHNHTSFYLCLVSWL